MKVYKYLPEFNLRIANGDDFDGDAWEDSSTGELFFTDPGELPIYMNDKSEESENTSCVLCQWKASYLHGFQREHRVCSAVENPESSSHLVNEIGL